MKRSTWIMLAACAVLLVLYFVQTRKPQPTAPQPLDIAGYIGNVSEQEARTLAKDKPSPVTRIVLKRKGQEIVLDKQKSVETAKPAEGATAPEAKWSARRSANGKTTQANVYGFRAQSMAETLMRTIRSTFSLPVKASDLAEYGLDPEHAIDVELVQPDRTVKLRIGHLDKPEMGDANTWVMDPARPDVVFQVAARDLRTSFDVSWSDMRDKTLLSLDLASVTGIEIQNPADKRAQRVVVKRPELTDAQRKELADKKSERDVNEGWVLAEPAGVRAGDIGDWLRAIDRLSANDFLDPAEVSAKKTDTGLDDPKTAARVTVATGKDKTVLVFGKSDETRPSRDVWLRIEGRDELYLVPTYNRDQVVQTLDQIRDRRLFGEQKVKDAIGFTLQGPDVRVVAHRAGGAWTISEPATLRASASAIETFLGELDSTKVDFASDQTAESAGLDTPLWSVTVQMGGDPSVVSLGKDVDGSTWGRASRGAAVGDIFKLTSWNAGRIKKKPADFADRKLIPLARADVAHLWIEPATGPAVHLQRGADGAWNLESGGTSSPAKPEAVEDLLGTVTSLEYVAEHPGKKPADAGIDKGFSRVRVADHSGQELELRISAVKAGEDFFAGLARKGRIERVVSIGSVAAASLQKTVEDFKK